MAQQHLRNIPAYLDVSTLDQPEALMHANASLFDDAGRLNDDPKKFLRTWMDHDAAWVRQHAA